MGVKIWGFGRRVLNLSGGLSRREWERVEGEGIVVPIGGWAFVLFDSLSYRRQKKVFSSCSAKNRDG